MRIEQISIQNIRGIESLEMKPGSLTVVSGSNGQGKSSVIAAIKATFEGGHDPSLIRNGEAKGVIEMTLSDGTQIKRTITQKASTLDVKTKDGDKKSAPAKYVEGLATGYALDPIALLTAKPKDRGAYLLEHMDVTFQPAEVQKAIGDTLPVDEALDLDGIGKLRKKLYEMRSEYNARARQSGETATGLRKTINAELEGTDWKAKYTELNSTLVDRSNELSRLEGEAKAQWQEFAQGVREDYAAQIKALEAKRDKELAEALEKFNEEKAQATAELSGEVAALTGEVAKAKALAEEQTRTETTRKMIEHHEAQYREADKASDRLTKAMEKLDALKTAKMQGVGIDGVEIVDGDILVNGIPFDALNTAQRYQLAFMLAAQGVKQLPLMICDQAEVFDGEAWKEFKAAAAESGMQIIAARVEDGPLSVKAVA